MALDRDALVGKGWRFGVCFTPASAPALCDVIHTTCDDGSFFIAVTHDCSVVHPSLEAEPFIEWLLAVPIANPDGQCTNARSIRKLHFEVIREGQPIWCEVSMAQRGFVGREGIGDSATCGVHALGADALAVLKRWLSNRYTTQTFPDSFNERIKPLVNGRRSPLRRLFDDELGQSCSGLYLSLSPHNEELPKDEPYSITVVALFPESRAREIGRSNMEEFASSIRRTLESAAGLGEIDVFALDEADVTYSQIVKMARWQLDYISLAGDAEVVIAEQS